MITLYGIPNCDTIKKTRKWLDEHKVAYQFHDYKKEGITAAALNEWCKQAGWERILNKKSTTWRDLSDADKNSVTDAASAIPQMQEHTSLIKRPVITKGKKVVVIGYDEAALTSLIG